jgi:hypothetical protein
VREEKPALDHRADITESPSKKRKRGKGARGVVRQKLGQLDYFLYINNLVFQHYTFYNIPKIIILSHFWIKKIYL